MRSFTFIALLVALVAVAPTANNHPHSSPSLFVAADLVQVGLKSGMGADYIVGPAHAASWSPMETEAPPKPAPAPAPAPAGAAAAAAGEGRGVIGIEPGSSIVVLQGGTVVGPGGVVAAVPGLQQPVPVQQPVPAVQVASVVGGAAGNSAFSPPSAPSPSLSVAAPGVAYILLDDFVSPKQGFGTAISAVPAVSMRAELLQGERPGFGAAAVLPAAAAAAAANFVAPADAYAAAIPSAYFEGLETRAAATVPAVPAVQAQQQLQGAAAMSAAGPIVVVASTPQAPAPAPAPEVEAPKSKPKPLLRPSLGAYRQFKNATEDEKKEKSEVVAEKRGGANGTTAAAAPAVAPAASILSSSSRAPQPTQSFPGSSKHKFGTCNAKEALIFSMGLISVGLVMAFAILLVWQLVAMVRMKKKERGSRSSGGVEGSEGGKKMCKGEQQQQHQQQHQQQQQQEAMESETPWWRSLRWTKREPAWWDVV